MYLLAKSADSIVRIFTRLCLSHVKEQLTENLLFAVLNPESFVCNGHLFTFIYNPAVLSDESILEYCSWPDLADRVN